jgi:HSP20 family molecular chaperone IbpA
VGRGGQPENDRSTTDRQSTAEDGVLHVALPKSEVAKPKPIKIKAA